MHQKTDLANADGDAVVFAYAITGARDCYFNDSNTSWHGGMYNCTGGTNHYRLVQLSLATLPVGVARLAAVRRYVQQMRSILYVIYSAEIMCDNVNVPLRCCCAASG